MGTVRYTAIDGEVVAEKRNGVRKSYVPDVLGSTVALLDTSQATTDTFNYTAYGQGVQETGSTPTPFRYQGTSGCYWDGAGADMEASGLHYVRDKYYVSGSGRWLVRGSQGVGRVVNGYRYLGNNPASGGVIARTATIGVARRAAGGGIGRLLGAAGRVAGMTVCLFLLSEGQANPRPQNQQKCDALNAVMPAVLDPPYYKKPRTVYWAHLKRLYGEPQDGTAFYREGAGDCVAAIYAALEYLQWAESDESLTMTIANDCRPSAK